MIINGAVVQNGGGDVLVGNGVLRTEQRAMAPFNRIELRGVADLVYGRSDQRCVSIRADENLLSLVELEVIRDELFVTTRANTSFSTRNPITILVQAPELTALAIHGAGDAMLEDLQQDNLSIAIHGSGDVIANGQVRTVQLRVNGSGDLNATGLDAKEADVRLNGSGDIQVKASESVFVRLNGSGDILVIGSPTERDAQCHGSGDIKIR